ncbi:lamin tail domain-containing protein [bacterium]|nr:lamin tail domain-containing protein [bacterium]
MKKRFLVACGLATALSVGSAQATVLINEIDADTPGTDAAEFVELYNDGASAVDLAGGGYVLVLFNGSNDEVYASIDLTGSLAASDYLVIGSSTVANVDMTEFTTNGLQNGADAVALYSGTSAASIPATTLVGDVTATLVDAVVYGTGDADATNLINALTPGQAQVDESSNGASADQSSQRIPDGGGGALNTGSFEQAAPTPGAANSVPTDPIIDVSRTEIDFGTFNTTNSGSPVESTIEITNVGGGTLNVSSFTVANTSGSAFSVSTVTSPNPVPAIPAALAAGESVTLVVAYENAVDADANFTGTVDYVTDAATGGSGSVPITADFVTIAQLASVGDVLINEFSYDPNPGTPNPIQDYNNDTVGDSIQDEFVELYNTTGAAINLKGWSLSASSTMIIPDGVSIDAGGRLVIFGGGTPNLPGINAITGGPSLGNSGGTIALSDGVSVIDSVSYIVTGEGAIQETAATSDGGSVGRYMDGATDDVPTARADSFVEFPWDSATNPPTPGTSNDPTAVKDWTLY